MGSGCRICGGEVRPWLTRLYDDRYGFPGAFDVLACGVCGHKQLDARFSEEELSRLYTDYYPRKTLSEEAYQAYAPVDGLASWLNGERSSAYHWVPSGVRVLDIGCGTCGTLGYHRARGSEAYGVEADGNVRAIVERQGFNVRIGLFDASNYEERSFDYVTMDQVIEHLADPIETLRGVAKILRRGGVAILSTPNSGGWGARAYGARWINWHVPYHLHVFSRRSLAIAVEKAGLKLTRLRTITSSAWLHYQRLHLANFPAPGQPSPFWIGPNPVAPRSAVLLHTLRINHLLTRIADCLGKGDNLLAFVEK